jgi:hypothetical protein
MLLAQQVCYIRHVGAAILKSIQRENSFKSSLLLLLQTARWTGNQNKN